jgi:large subunit ribosomal protein L35
MPKAKTKSGAKKRFQITGSGKIKRKKAFKRHILTKKETARKRALGNDALVHPSNAKSIKKQLLVPNA